MGRKGSSKSWFQSIGNERAEVNRPGPFAGHAVGQPRPQAPSTGPVPVILSASTDETTAAEVPLVRKRKTKAVDTSHEASKKRKEVVDETERPLPQGVWDPAFTLGHKVDLNMDASEKKVFENMSEQEIADTMLEMTTRAQGPGRGSVSHADWVFTGEHLPMGVYLDWTGCSGKNIYQVACPQFICVWKCSRRRP
ncbi:hypothetical protein LR48_Vigan02g227200 [Vigna angularis]|uniref:Uncharacterized protein n=1 Tax=Phaseolus angularis TaxID=3914 RepID=A0A0L9U0D2_PHAAN|nr:hypothetical protein LR48_Vigan02g227200 [Vigna angularis]